jgi:hypothetical protein
MKRSLPVAKSLLAAVAFVPRAITQAPAPLFLVAALLAAPALMTGLPMSLPPRLAARVLLAGLMLVAGLIAQGALYRLAVTPTVAAARCLGLGPLGLQFGAAEVRLLISGLLVLLFLGLAVLAAALLLALVANILEVDGVALARGARPEGWRAWTLLGAVVLAGWLIFNLAIRLSLYKAAAVARRRLVSVSAQGLSEGHFWRLLVGLAIVSLPAIALALLVHAGGLHAAWLPRAWAQVALALGLAFLQLPLSIGFLGAAYQRLEHWRAA